MLSGSYFLEGKINSRQEDPTENEAVGMFFKCRCSMRTNVLYCIALIDLQKSTALDKSD